MSNIRWNNVAAPNVGDISALLRGASTSINSGLGQFQDMIKQSWLRDEEAKKQKEAEIVDQFKAGMTANLDPEAVRSGIESGQYQDMISGMDVTTATKSKLRDSLLPFLSNAEAYQSNKRKSVDEAKALEEKAQTESMLPAVRTLEAAAMSANPQARQEAITAATAIADRMTDPTKFLKSIYGLAAEGEKQQTTQQESQLSGLVDAAIAKAQNTPNTAILDPRDAKAGIKSSVSDTEKYDIAQKDLLANVPTALLPKAQELLKLKSSLLSTSSPTLFGADAEAKRKAEEEKTKEVTAAKNAYDMVETMAKRQANSLGLRSLATLDDAEGTTEIEAGFADAGMGANAKDKDALDRRGYIQAEIAKLKKTPEGKLLPASAIADIIRTIPQDPGWLYTRDAEIGDNFKEAVMQYLKEFGTSKDKNSLAAQIQLLRNNVRASQTNYEQKLSKYGYTETGKK